MSPVGRSVALEIGATAVGGLLLWLGVAMRSVTAPVVALIVWVTTLEPLCKMAVGSGLGIRYDYAYLRGIEPRFKMCYGTYLAASRPARIVLHLSGCVGSPLAAWLVARLTAARIPLAATIATVVFDVIVAVNAGLFLAAVVGIRRLGSFPLAASSGGAAGSELRQAS